MNRVQNTKLILWLITGFAAAVGITRFIFGLGATTNLSDATPWGLWIGFDVMGGVALAAGGFVLTAIVYIMKRDKFHPLVRPAVLTAFLGYLAVIFGLLFDLGLPWNIWHMMIYWNPHSPLFEVGWCVMLYTTVLLLEFSPVPLESTSRYARVRKFLMKFRFLFVLLGIMLSTLHQSSLGRSSGIDDGLVGKPRIPLALSASRGRQSGRRPGQSGGLGSVDISDRQNVGYRHYGQAGADLRRNLGELCFHH
jgi:Ni/Fe-hydrogenase subunit HybB-like protein